MSPTDEAVEIEVTFDDGLLARIDRLRHRPGPKAGYDTRSDVVAAAIEAAGE